MENAWFYIQLGLAHVLDLGAYDHILFLAALAIPFQFSDWRKVILLATVFTITHCVALGISVYELIEIEGALIEFLIPVTIFLTALFNIYLAYKNRFNTFLGWHLGATAFFGLVHGFGFSSYFKMMMAGESNKFGPLVGFAAGIELSQLCIILGALLLGFICLSGLKLKRTSYVMGASLLVIIIVVPMLINTFPQ